MFDRQRLLSERNEARRAVLLVTLKRNEEAILRSVTELQPTGELRMPIPYRDRCRCTLANGKYFTTATFGRHAVMSAKELIHGV